MQNIIIIGILVVAILLGIKESAKHFRGEGGCCGGGSSKPKNKKLRGKIVKIYLFQIEGMHCQNCANKVTRAINDIGGASARVKLGKKQVKVLCNRQIDPKTIMEVIERIGYTVSLK